MGHNWERLKIKDVATVIGGSTPKTEVSEYWGGNNYWVTPAELTGDKYVSSTVRCITDLAVQKASLTLMPVGTVLLTSRAPIGKVAITRSPMYCNQGFKNIVCGESVYNEFLYYYLKYNVGYLQSLGTGATFKEISKKVVENITIALPPYEEQKRIAAELDLLSGIIEGKSEQIRDVDRLYLSVFYDTFGNPVSNLKGWKAIPLSDVTTLITDGSHYSPKDNERGTNRMLSVKDMGSRGFDYTNCKWITYDEFVKLEAAGCRPQPDDVLVAKDGSYFKRIFVYRSEAAEAILSSIAIVRPNKSIVTPEFLCTLLSTPDIYNLVEERYLTGTAIKRVILKGLRQLKIIVPPLEMQKDFSKKVWRLDTMRRLIDESKKEAEKLFDSRMNFYFGD